MHRRLLLAALTIAAVVAMGATVLLSRDSHDDGRIDATRDEASPAVRAEAVASELPTAADDSAAEDARGTSAGESPATPTGSAHAALPDGSFHAIRPQLEELAQQGNAEAQFRLGNTLARCVGFRSTPREEVERMLVRMGSSRSVRGTMLGMRLDDPRLITILLEQHAQAEEMCAGAAGIDEPGQVEAGVAWLERAAASGHMPAKVAYVDLALQRWPSEDAVVNDAERVRATMRQQERWLAEALAAGEPGALRARSNLLAARDPVEALASWHAWSRTDDAKWMSETTSEVRAEQIGRELRDAERERARTRADELLRELGG